MSALRCPYHSWTYDLDGRLLKAPHTQDVVDFEPREFALHPVGVGTWGGFVFVHLSPSEATELSDELAPFGDRLRRYPLRRLVTGLSFIYDVDANYKVLAENYNECYHCGPVHPELTRLVPAFGGGPVRSAGRRASRTAKVHGRSPRPARPTVGRSRSWTSMSAPVIRVS
jgi:Rieske 2Fe-2S family protein